MTRTTLIAVAAFMVLAGCMSPNAVTGRADNDMLRFSAMNYTLPGEAAGH